MSGMDSPFFEVNFHLAKDSREPENWFSKYYAVTPIIPRQGDRIQHNGVYAEVYLVRYFYEDKGDSVEIFCRH